MFFKTKRITLLLNIVVLSFILISITTQSAMNITPTTKTSNELMLNENTPIMNSIVETTTTTEDDIDNSTTFDFIHLSNYLLRHYTATEHAFKDNEGYYTTTATYNGFMISKMTGLERYIVSDEALVYSEYLKTLRADDLRGFAIHNELDASLTGTFNVLSILELINRADYISNNRNSSYFIKEDCLTVINETQITFKEIAEEEPTLESTYYGLKSLEILENQLEAIDLAKVANFIASTWNDDGYFDDSKNNDFIMDSWYAIYSLDIISNYINLGTTDVNPDYVTDFTDWLLLQQDDLNGGFGVNNATSYETGAALSILRLFDSLDNPSLNQEKAIEQILYSQYNNNTIYDGHGGFSPSNETHYEDYHFVTIENSFWATLGLYSTDYFINKSTIKVETEYFRYSTIQAEKYEVVQGEETNFYIRIVYNETYSFTAGVMDLDAANWNITKSDVIEEKNLNVFYYKYNIEVNDTDWSLGNHSFSISYETRNISFFEPTKRIYDFNLSVRLDLDLNYPTDENNDGKLSPGEDISFYISATNKTLNKETIYHPYGNVTVTLLDPQNEEVTLQKTVYLWPESANNTYINITLPAKLHLGQYKIIFVHSNDSIILSTSKMQITINDEVYLGIIGGNRELYPGNPYTLNFTYYYKFSHSFPDDANISVGFVSEASGETLFSENLVRSFLSYIVDPQVTVPNKMIMGKYNISSTVYWKKSDGTHFSNPKDAINNTLKTVTVIGIPVILENENNIMKPFDERSEVYYGESINVTVKIGIILPNDDVINVNDSIILRAEIINRTSEESLQYIDSELLDNDTVRFVGEINPNLKPVDDYSFRAQVYSRYNNSYIPLYDNRTNDKFIINMSISGTLELELPDIPNYNPENTSVATLWVKVFCEESSNYVSGLNLYAGIKRQGANESQTLYGINNVETSYQIVFPITNIEDDIYSISIIKVTDNELIGTFEIEVESIFQVKEIPIVSYVVLVLSAVFAAIVLYNLFLRLRI